jgi:hypothetical protein
MGDSELVLALSHEDVAVNPTSNLQLPANQGKRERFAAPAEMTATEGGSGAVGDRCLCRAEARRAARPAVE